MSLRSKGSIEQHAPKTFAHRLKRLFRVFPLPSLVAHDCLVGFRAGVGQDRSQQFHDALVPAGGVPELT